MNAQKTGGTSTVATREAARCRPLERACAWAAWFRGRPARRAGGEPLRIGATAVMMLMAAPRVSGDWIDQLDRKLTTSALDDRMRARVSGTLDLEGYHFTEPAPGLIETEGDGLFNPRLSTFLDAQYGANAYAFAQARVDRGFDPEREKLGARLDEYAVRLALGQGGAFNVQLGKFATVVGNWVPRHGSWENGFVTAPLPYENLTGVWDAVAANSVATLLNWSRVRPPRTPGGYDEDKYLRLPIVWGPSYATGVAVFGELQRFTYALEWKNAALASRPDDWTEVRRLARHPTVSGRLGWRPDERWTLGFSASTGSYLRDGAVATVAPGHGLGDYREIVLAQDVGFAWHHLQVWAEFYEARFEIPNVGDADTFAYYGEVRYRLAPQLTAALRWNQQLYSTFATASGARVPWSPEKWRIDFAPAWRFTAHLQLKLQYSLEHDAVGPREFAHLLAAQLTLRF
jgi:hypothetical protein